MESMHRFADLLGGAERFRDQRRVDDSGTYAMRPDARGRELERRVAGESDDAMLGRVVCRKSDTAANACHRCGVDDRAALLRDHHFARELESPKDAVEIDADRI